MSDDEDEIPTPETNPLQAPTANPVGRPQHAPNEQTRRMVEMGAAIGLTEEQLGLLLGVTAPTLRRHYKAELRTGHLKATMTIANNLFVQATKNDPKCIQAAMFWLRCKAGWSEFAPAPPVPRPKEPTTKLGKKEQRQQAAENASDGSDWHGLVN